MDTTTEQAPSALDSRASASKEQRWQSGAERAIDSPAAGDSQGSQDRELVQRKPEAGQLEVVLRQPADDGRTVTKTYYESDREGAPAVRLGMDLDVDVQMKAKIQGDVTLSIL